MKLNILKPVDNLKKLHDKLNHEMAVKHREFNDIQDSIVRLKNFRESRKLDAPNHLEREVEDIKSMIQNQITSSVLSTTDIDDIKILLPKEEQQIKEKISKLSAEIDLMTKFNKDFNNNLYEGIDMDRDQEKLKAYVGYFSEFKNTVQKEANAVDREVEIMKEHLVDLESISKMVKSV